MGSVADMVDMLKSGLGPFEYGMAHLADARDGLRQIPDGSVRLIFTDPPYGIEHNSKTLSSVRGEAFDFGANAEEKPITINGDTIEEALKLMTALCLEAARILDPAGSAICICCPSAGPPIPIFAHLGMIMGSFLDVQASVFWNKRRPGMGWRYRRQCEMILVGSRKGKKMSWFDTAGNITNLASCSVERQVPGQGKLHPHRKPVELIEEFLRLHTQAGDIVLDPFSGSGSTLVACERSGRFGVAFDNDQRWVDYTNERVTKECGRGLPMIGMPREQLSLSWSEPDVNDAKDPDDSIESTVGFSNEFSPF